MRDGITASVLSLVEAILNSAMKPSATKKKFHRMQSSNNFQRRIAVLALGRGKLLSSLRTFSLLTTAAYLLLSTVE
eukprot:scaffold145888_cov43-Attheya_sp.AAC.1